MKEIFYITDHNGAYLNGTGAFSVFGVAQAFYSYGEAETRIGSIPGHGYYQIQKFFLTQP